MKKIVTFVYLLFLLSGCYPYSTTSEEIFGNMDPTQKVKILTSVYFIPDLKVGDEMVSYWEDMGCDFTIPPKMDEKLLEDINSVRLQNGLAVLEINEDLRESAQGHVVDMLCQNYYSHISPDNSTPSNRVVKSGYLFKIIEENLAGIPITDPNNIDEDYIIHNAIRGWSLSESHNKAMLDTKVSDFGAAIACGDTIYNGQEFTLCYLAVEFGLPQIND